MPTEYRVPVKRVVHAPPKVIQIVGRFGRSLETAQPAVEQPKPAPNGTIINDAPVDKARPKRPEDKKREMPGANGAVGIHAEKPKRRSSVLDDLLAAKGLRWKSSEPEKTGNAA